MNDDIVFRLRSRASIRRQIPNRKSVQEGKPDRISDLLEEAADAIDQKILLIAQLRSEIDAVMSEGQEQFRLKNTYLNQLLDIKRISGI